MKENIFTRIDKNEKISPEDKAAAIKALEAVRDSYMEKKMESLAERAQRSINSIESYKPKRIAPRTCGDIAKDIELCQEIIIGYRNSRNYKAEAEYKTMMDELEKEFQERAAGRSYDTEKIRCKEIFINENDIPQGFQQII